MVKVVPWSTRLSTSIFPRILVTMVLTLYSPKSRALAGLLRGEEWFKNLIQDRSGSIPHPVSEIRSLTPSGKCSVVSVSVPPPWSMACTALVIRFTRMWRTSSGLPRAAAPSCVCFRTRDIVKADRIAGDFQRFVKPVVKRHHRIIAGRRLSGILRQIPADGACPPHGFDDFLRLLVDGFQVGFLDEVFGQPHDQLQWIVDVVRNARGKRADPGQFFCVKQLGSGDWLHDGPVPTVAVRPIR